MWSISFGLSLASALFAVMLQGWNRWACLQMYNELPCVPGDPHHSALILLSLIQNTERYRVRHVSRMCFLLPHISVYLFVSGLVLVLHTIDMTVAIVADVAVGVFVLVHIYCSSRRIHASP